MTVVFGSISASSLVNQLTATVTCPSGTATGDLLLLFGLNDEPFAYLVPSGFTLLGQPSGVSADVGSGVFYRFATSGDVAGTTTYSMTESGGSGTQGNVAACIRYTGVDSNAFPGAAFVNTSPTNLNPTTARIGLAHGGGSGGTTTTAANAACQAPTNPTTVNSTDTVFRVYMSGDNASATGKTMSGAPAGWTQRGSYISNVSGKFNVGMIVCDRAGATDTATITSNLLSIYDIYTVSLPAKTTAANFLPFFM